MLTGSRLAVGALSAALLLASSARGSRPGDPPQCYEPHYCISTFVIAGTPWYYDLSSLCATNGSEYRTWQASEPAPGPTVFPQLIFNVCGTVSLDIAPFNAANAPANVVLPFPASHGVAVQLIDDPSVGPGVGQQCADVDSCDQSTNPQCAPSSLNYDATRDGENPHTLQPILHNAAREAVCASAPSTDFCTVQTVPCTESSEVLAQYTGGEATLGEGLDVRLNDANDAGAGINVTLANLPAFASDPYPCTTLDPATGNVVPRSINIFIACDAAAPTLQVESYSEPVQCSYYILARAAAACGTTDSPYALPSFSSTASSSISATATATASATATATATASGTASGTATATLTAAATPAARVEGYSPAVFAGSAFGFTLLGALVVAPLGVFLISAASSRGLAPSWLTARVGGGGAAATSSSRYRPVDETSPFWTAGR